VDRRRKFVLYAALVVGAVGAVVVLLAVKSQDEEALRTVVVAAARRHGVDPRLADAVAKAESRYNPKAISRASAYGLMQLTVPTAEHLLGRSVKAHELFDPRLNADLGCRYLARLAKSYDGDLRLVLMAYNAGPGRVSGWRQREPDPDRILATIAFPETRAYVERVLGYMGR